MNDLGHAATLLALVSVFAVVPGCGSSPAVPADASPPVDAPTGTDASSPTIPAVGDLGTIAAANAVPTTDPRFEGQQRFLWDAMGTELLDEWPPADFMLALISDEPDVFGDQYAQFGFVADPDDDFPVGLKRGLDNPTRVHETCALCHVGRLPDGRLWMGAPAGTLNIGRFRVEVSRRWAAAGHEPLLTPLGETKALALGPGRTNAESSSYPDAVAADFPVYFALSTRTHLNYLGTGGNVRTEAYFSVFSFGAGNPLADDGLVPFPPAERVDPLVDFLGSLAAPALAPAEDGTLVASGAAVFARERCGECHHVDDLGLDEVVTYDEAPDEIERYPGDDDAFPRGSVRTDPLHRVLQEGDGSGDGMDTDRLAAILDFAIRNRLSVGPTDGYRPSDLHGVWATAPYFHNGSVPTLTDVLSPAADRPVTFDRAGFAVDTTAPGSSSVGHEFGTTLDVADRDALVAYLRSL